METVLLNSLPIFVAVAVGYFLVRRKIVPENASETIGQIIFKIVGPLMVFSVIYGTKIDFDRALLIFSPFVIIVLMIVTGFAVSRLSRLSKKQEGAVILCMMLFGAGAVYPFVDRNFSSETFSYFVMTDILQFMLFLVVAPVVGVLLGRRVNGSAKIEARTILRKIATDPFLIAMVLAFACTYAGITLPDAAIETVDFFANSAFMLLSLYAGMVLKMPSSDSVLKIGAVYAVRLIVIYGLVFLLFSLGGFDILEVSVASLLYSAPFAVIVVLYAQENELDHEFAAQVILFSIAAQLIVYPLLITFLVGM